MAKKRIDYNLRDLTEEQARERGELLHKIWKQYKAKEKIFEIISKKSLTS